MPRQVMGAGSRRKAPQGTGKVHVRRGDRVRVIRGNYAGQEGTVIRVLTDRNRVIVEGVNERTRHVRPSQENPEGGRIKSFEPIDASNVMLIDPSSGEPSRARKRVAKDGTKERIATRSGNPIPKTTK
jgi:large subunit ribosomal protein L24